MVLWISAASSDGGADCSGVADPWAARAARVWEDLGLMQGVEERLDEERRSLGIHYVAGSAHLVCPWHGWEFDLRSGRHCGHDAARLLAHPVTVRDGGVYVGIRG